MGSARPAAVRAAARGRASSSFRQSSRARAPAAILQSRGRPSRRSDAGAGNRGPDRRATRTGRRRLGTWRTRARMGGTAVRRRGPALSLPPSLPRSLPLPLSPSPSLPRGPARSKREQKGPIFWQSVRHGTIAPHGTAAALLHCCTAMVRFDEMLRECLSKPVGPSRRSESAIRDGDPSRRCGCPGSRAVHPQRERKRLTLLRKGAR